MHESFSAKDSCDIIIPPPATGAGSPLPLRAPATRVEYLVGTDSVHTSAAACDYLEPRLTADDAVVAVAIVESDDPVEERDRQEALTAFRVRLAGTARVETELREGDAVAELRAAADERGAEEIVVGPHRGDPDADATPGETLVDLLTATTRPVTVLSFA